MSAVRSRTRARTAAVAAASLVAAGFALVTTAPAAQAAPSSLVISEVYGGGGSSSTSPLPSYKQDYVELQNNGSTSVNLSGKSLQYRSGSGTTTSGVKTLSGTIAPNGGKFLVQMGPGSGNGGDIPTPDYNAGTAIAMSGSAGTVFLVNGTTAVAGSVFGNADVVDLVGYAATAAGNFETTATPALSITTAASRNAAGTDTDNNANDFSAGTPNPQNSSSTPPGGTITVTTGGDKTNTTGASVSGTFTASGGAAPYTFSATNLPSGVVLNSDGTYSGTASPSGTYNVVVTATDSSGPPAKTGTGSFTWTITNPAAATPIADIQGNGSTVAITGNVTTEGVVTAAYPTRGLNGFFIQTPGPDTSGKSDAIFVYGGSSGFTTYPAVGDSVRVTGTAGENAGQSQITATNAGVTSIASLGTVNPKTQVPGTNCALNSCDTLATLGTAREAMEGELVQPTAPWTVTDAYDFSPAWPGTSNSSGHFGEIGVAADSSMPLVAPTEIVDAQNTTGIAARTTYNNAHRITLDDGSSLNFTLAANQSTAFPWLTNAHTVRVGAAVTFPQPVVFTNRNTDWRLIPTTPVAGAPSASQPQISQTRAANLVPQNVGGDVKLATFNVLNFFPTTGEEYVNSGLGSCSYYSDRAGNRITTNSCGTSSDPGPRGAANNANLVRQRDKIVAAINASTADVVSLEELENSVKFGKNRDFAIGQLVNALNADAGAGTWDFVPSPSAANLPGLDEQDVIRTGFIYRPGRVVLVGGSVVLADESGDGETFANAREPLAQAFKKKGSPRNTAFSVIVNHFKSKGSGTDDGTGQGNSNPDRIAQADSLMTFATQFQNLRSVTKTFLVGDFNAYSEEDPIQRFTSNGYTELHSTSNPDEESYNFDGQVGSLDHVLYNGPANDIAGVDVWELNGNESVYYEYSRYNYNVTDLYSTGPFRSSDHSPEIVGINVSTATAATTTTANDASVFQGSDVNIPVTVAAQSGTDVPTGDVTLTTGSTNLGTGTLSGGAVTINADTSGLAAGTYTVTATYSGDDDFASSSDTLTLTVNTASADIQILGTNDFHGRIQNDPASASAGAAVMAGAVKSLRQQNPNTVFAAAGDLIGASTFESFIAKDKPTIDALNSAGLEVSAVGNHEFDQGYNDLVNRVMAPYDAQTNPYGGASWKYLGANVKLRADDSDALDRVWTKTMDGVKVGFIGAVTEHLPELVSPAGIQDIKVTDIVNATNSAANQLKANGADIVVLLVHEGAAGTDCNTIASDTTSDFGKITSGVNENVDAIVSGHTHLLYNCSVPVPGWSSRPVTTRPVVSAGQYGTNLNKLVFTVDKTTDTVTAKTQTVLPLKSCSNSTACTNYTADGPTASIVAAAVSNADTLGAVEVGRVAAPFKRAFFSNGTTENRGGESTLGNLVAEVQRWATSAPTFGSAQIAFMNPGGLRTDILGTSDSGAGLKVTYKQAANVQPFANTLVNMTLTGAQIRTALEQQWQPTGSSRPFLRLGISKGFTYTYDPQAATGSRIKQMRLNGTLIGDSDTFSVTVNSFLASGGDNFLVFNNGAGKRDTGKVDLQSMVDYLDEYANTSQGDSPLPVDYSQRSVGVRFPSGAPAAYSPGDNVQFDVSSWSMSNSSDVKDTEVTVKVDGTTVATATLDNSPQTGTSGGFDEVGKASVSFTMPDLPMGTTQVTLLGTTTGTSVRVPVEVGKAPATVLGEDVTVAVNKFVKLSAAVTGTHGLATGTVEFFEGSTSLGTGPVGPSGNGRVTLNAGSLSVGPHTIRAVYSGDAAYLGGAQDNFTVEITKAPSTVSATNVTKQVGKDVPVTVRVATAPVWPVSGMVTISENGTDLASATVAGKDTVVTIPAGLSVGVHTLDVTYTGDDEVNGGTTTVTVTITKANSKLVASALPAKPRAGRDVTVTATVTGLGAPASGDVEISVDGAAPTTVTLDANGVATLNIGSFSPVGSSHNVVITYLGNNDLKGATVTKTIIVRA